MSPQPALFLNISIPLRLKVLQAYGTMQPMTLFPHLVTVVIDLVLVLDCILVLLSHVGSCLKRSVQVTPSW